MLARMLDVYNNQSWFKHKLHQMTQILKNMGHVLMCEDISR